MTNGGDAMTYDECAEDYEDEFGVTAWEPTHSDEDDEYYVQSILTGEHDRENQGRDYDGYEGPDGLDDYPDDMYADFLCNQWERSYWGD